jgi:mannose-6-phosphate isomerase-like protein (cupin superfamily)
MSKVYEVRKLWGRELWYWNGNYCMKALVLNHGFRSSLHYHLLKRETFLVVSGVVALEYKGQTTELATGDAATIEPGESHRFWSVTTYGAVVVEASTHHDDADVVRVEPSSAI